MYLDRRSFIYVSGGLLGGLWTRSNGILWELVALPQAVAQTNGPKEFYDLLVSGPGIREVVPAQAWQTGKNYTLKAAFEPNSHNHAIMLTADNFKTLGSTGSLPRFRTQMAAGHDHGLRVVRAPNANVIPNNGIAPPTPPNLPKPSIPNPESTSPTGPGSANSNLIAAMLGEGERPYLYVEVLQPMQRDSMFYCLGDETSCAKMDWVEMLEAPVVPGRMFYRSRYKMKLRPQDVLHISVKDITGKRHEMHLRANPVQSSLLLK